MISFRKIDEYEYWLCASPMAKVAILTNLGHCWVISCLGESYKFTATDLDHAKKQAYGFVIPIVEDLLRLLKTHEHFTQ